MKNNHTEKKVEEKINKSNNNQEEHILWLNEIMFFVSHRVRQPVAHVLGLSNLINIKTNSPTELNKIILYIKQSVLLLDNQTRVLSILINKKIIKLKNKKSST